MTNKNAYAQSGVDVEAGYEVVERIKKHVARTERAGVMGALGGFGGMFDLSKTGVKEPVLISGTDGVGTKLMLAIKYDKHDTIGQDCVAMCVNDIIAAGAEPLYFLDYVATGKNEPAKLEQVVAGGAAHLPGMVAAKTTLPVIGVPVKSRALSGVDSLYSIVQMPGGVPVATMAIGEAGATNAALFALRLLSVEDKSIADALANFAEEQGKIAEESSNELI
ncbi:phosphoribosylaminoimidazole synthetase [Streptococcus pneumoniae]|nr:phosphoribosylaminoimidazole synthetase [Streptococcus pneumoniae]